MVDTSKVDFNAKVASTAISACSTLIEHLLTVQSFLGSRNVDSFAGPPDEFNSGEAWAEGFRKLDTDLGGALNGHITVVTDLSEKFKAAIKEFKNAEDESIAGFLNQKMPDKLTNPAGLGPDYSKVNSKVPTPKPVEKYNTNHSGRQRTQAYDYSHIDLKDNLDRVAWPENPYTKGWDALAGLGANIKGVPGRLAADWGWMKDELNKAVTNFNTDTIDGHFRNSWSNGSGQAALAALDKAKSAISDLTSKMGDVEDRLYKAEGWLKATKERMPTGKAPEVLAPKGGNNNGGKSTTSRYMVTDRNTTYAAATAQDCMEMVLAKYRQDCEAYYVAGIMEYNTSLVAIPQPEAPKAPAPPSIPQPGDQPKNDDQPKDTPQVSPSGTPTGGNPSTPNTPTTPTDTPTTPQTPTTQTPTNTNTNTNTDTTLTTLTSALTTLAQDGVQMVESLASQGSSLIQSLVSSQTTQKTTDTSAQQLEQQLASLLTPTTPADPSSPGGTPTSPGGTPTGGTPTTPKVDTPKTQLFPRANVATEEEKSETVTASRAGLATGTATGTGTSSGTGMSGSPMGAAGGAGQAGGKEHKRPEFLRSGQNLDDVFEGIPEAVRPVAEQ
ncbi:hypothetical protein ACIRRA_00290 [Nocardia sp. NPDC101769]|uniref:hypothetical protein n=1 Tax=Nocardia sp. NPDC101769 TaxID=3364333 RepID=UPI003805B9F9